MDRKNAIPLPVISPPAAPRRWGLGHWRVASLVLVHLLIIAHAAHWLITGRTLTPVEPSESMETLQTGAVNAGFVFFALALLLTLIFGRFVCGWACHFVAYQDLSLWLLGKIGIRPRPLRSRLLLFVPLGMAIYMFVWPSLYRVWVVARGSRPDLAGYFPKLSNGFMTEHFWETFPGWVFALLSVGIAGFSIVYFLGAKGFCTYACPYGAFFGIADRFAPMRVRVSSACDHTGVCTTVCSSNVDVAEEIRQYGMVVSPGCLKCGDCIRSCPNSALSWSMGRPAAFAGRPSGAQRPSAPDLSWREEFLLLALFLFYLLAWRGLYSGFPFLMSAGMAAIMAFVTLTALRMLYRREVALQSTTLRAEQRLTRAGKIGAALVAVLAVFTAHSLFVQYQRFAGHRAYDRIIVDQRLREAAFDPQRDLDASSQHALSAASAHYKSCLRWGLLPYPDVRFRMAWIELLRGESAAAQKHVQALIAAHEDWTDLYHLLGVILRIEGRTDEAVAAFRQALDRDPGNHAAALDLGITLIRDGRLAEAEAHYAWQAEHFPDDAGAHYHLGALAVGHGDVAAALPHLERAIALQPDLADAHYQLGFALLLAERIDDAIPRLQEAIRLQPAMAPAHYNLGVAFFMRGDLPAASRRVRDALRLDPQDAQARQFLQMLDRQSGNSP